MRFFEKLVVAYFFLGHPVEVLISGVARSLVWEYTLWLLTMEIIYCNVTATIDVCRVAGMTYLTHIWGINPFTPDFYAPGNKDKSQGYQAN